MIHKHFWLKREEICAQIEGWIEELSKPQYTERASRTISFNSMMLHRHYRHLREELAKLKPPRGLEDLDAPFNPVATLPPMDVSTAAAASATTSAQAGAEDSLVPELNLMVDNGDNDLPISADFYKVMDKSETLLPGEEDVIEILSDTENESSVWQDKEDDTP